MFHHKPWAILEVPTGQRKWGYVNNDAEEQFTSFAVGEDFIAVGNKNGSVDILRKDSLDLLHTFKTATVGSISKMRFSESDKQTISQPANKQDRKEIENHLQNNKTMVEPKGCFLAVVINERKIEVWKLSVSFNAAAEQKIRLVSELKRQNNIHINSNISSMCWAKDRDVYTGDSSGMVTVTRVLSKNILTGTCQQLFKLCSPIVQIDFCAPILLTSTHKTIALSNISRQVFREIPLEKNGPFGAVLKVVDKNATFMENSVRETILKAVCAGPDATVWIINVDTYDIERAYCFKSLIMDQIRKTTDLTNSEHKPDRIRESSVAILKSSQTELETVDFKSVEISATSNSSSVVKYMEADHLNFFQLHNFGKGIILAETSNGYGCAVFDVLNKAAILSGPNLEVVEPVSEVFVQYKEKSITTFHASGDMKRFLIQPTHKMLKRTSNDPLLKSSSAHLILQFPEIACNYLTQREMTEVMTVFEQEGGNKEEVRRLKQVADLISDEQKARFENSNRSTENEFDVYFQEMDTPQSLFKTGATMKNFLSNIQSKISDYETSMVENRVAKARQNYASQMHLTFASEVTEDIENPLDKLVSVAAVQSTETGIERVIFAPTMKIEPRKPKQLTSELPPILELSGNSAEKFAELVVFEEETQTQNKKKNKLLSLFDKVAENIETISLKKAASIEPHSLAIIEETPYNVEYLARDTSLTFDKGQCRDLVTSVWVHSGKQNSVQLVQPEVFSPRKETVGSVRSLSPTPLIAAKTRKKGHKGRKKLKQQLEASHQSSVPESSRPSSERDNQSIDSISVSGSYNETSELALDITTIEKQLPHVAGSSELDMKISQLTLKVEEFHVKKKDGVNELKVDTSTAIQPPIKSLHVNKQGDEKNAKKGPSNCYRTMQYLPPKLKQDADSVIQLARSPLGFARLVNSTSYQEAEQICEKIKLISSSDWSTSWTAFYKVSSQLENSTETATLLLDQNDIFHNIKILAIMSGGTSRVLSEWLAKHLTKCSAQEIWKSHLIRSLETYNWEFRHIEHILTSVLKSLTELLQPKPFTKSFKCTTCNKFKSNCSQQNRDLNWNRQDLIQFVTSVIRSHDPNLDCVSADHFKTKEGFINALGYLSALENTHRIEDRLNFCTVKLRKKEAVEAEIRKLVEEDLKDGRNQESMYWTLALDLAGESGKSEFCECADISTSEHSESELSFLEQLLLIFYKQKSLHELRELVKFWSDTAECERGRSRTLSPEFYQTLTDYEAWMMRKKHGMFKILKKADRSLLQQRATATTVDSRGLKSLSDHKWKVSIQPHKMVCSICCNISATSNHRNNYSRGASQKTVPLMTVFKCGHLAHATCWEDKSLCPQENCKGCLESSSNTKYKKETFHFDF